VEEDYVCDSYSPSDNSHQDQADNLPSGENEVDSTTSSFAGDLDWKLPVFDTSPSESGWRLAASPDELFIALNVPKPTADKIHAWAKEQDWPEGTELEEPSEYHITLLYSPKGHEEHKEAEWWTTDNSDNVVVKKLDEFPSQERGEQNAFVLRVDRPDDEIKIRMERLLDKAEEEGVEVNRYPGGSKPHITIAYGPKLPKGIKPPDISFSTDEAHCGKPRTSSVASDTLGDLEADVGSGWTSDEFEALISPEPKTHSAWHVDEEAQEAHDHLNDAEQQYDWEGAVSHDFRLADYNVQVPVVTPNQGVGLATPHQVGDLLSIQSVAHNLHYKYQQSGLDPNSAQQYASKLLQAIGYTNPDQPTIDAALQAWKAMYPEDARSAYALPGVATSSHDADGGFGDAALDWTDAHTASATDGEAESLALLEFSGLSGRNSDVAGDGKDDSLGHGWTLAHPNHDANHTSNKDEQQAGVEQPASAVTAELGWNEPQCSEIGEQPDHIDRQSNHEDHDWRVAGSPQTIFQPIRAIVDQGGQVHTFNDGHVPYSQSNGIDPNTNQAHLQIHQPSGEVEDLSGAHSQHEQTVADYLNQQTGEDRYHARPNDMDWVFGSAAGGAPQKSQRAYQSRIGEDMHVHEPKLHATGAQTLSNPSRQPVTQARAHESDSRGGSPSDELTSFLSHIHEGDSWDTRQWPDPLSDNGTGGNVPRGCTCQSGHKLDCPVHGLEANGEYDTMEWTIPEASPVGYPQDQPRNWQQAESSVRQSVRTRQEVDDNDEPKPNSKADQDRAKQRTNHGTEANEYEWHQVHAPSIAHDTSQGASATPLAHTAQDVNSRPSYKALLRPSGLRQSIEISGSENDLEWYSSHDSSYDLSHQKTSGPISDGTGTPGVTVEEVDAPTPLANDDPWNESFRDRRPLLYHVPTGRVLMGPPGSEHGSLYNHLGRTTPEWLPEEVHEGIIGKGGVKFFDDNSSNPEGYPQAAADAVVHHTGIAEDPEVDKEYGWDFNGSHRMGAQVINVPGNEDFDFQGRVPLIAHGENIYAGTNGETHDSLKARLGDRLQGVHPNDIAHGGMFVDHNASEYGITPGSYEWFDTNFFQPGSPHNQAVEDEIRRRGLEPKNLDDGFTFSKVAAVPVQYHGDIDPSEGYPGWEDGDMFGDPIGYAGRWPTVVHDGTVHIGPEQSTHGQVRQKLGLPATGEEPEGWIGPNPEAEEDNHDHEGVEFLPGEPEDGEGAPYGWYGHKGVPHQNTGITEAMMNYWNTFLRHREPTPGTGYGHGPRMSGVSVHEVGEPTDSGTEWHGTRRPFTYFPHTQDLILGAPGADHAAMLYADKRLFQKYRRQQLEPDTAQGGVYNDPEGNKVVEYYYGTPEDEHVQAVQNALGAQRSQLNEWHVGDDVHDNPDKTWDFNSKIAQTMYHWAPRAMRDQISQQGLRAALPEGDEYVDYDNPDAYKGVYLFNRVPAYTPGGSKGFYGDDLWAVDTHGLNPQVDEGEWDASMIPHDITPDRIQFLNSPAHRKAWEQQEEERYGKAPRTSQEGPTGDELQNIEDSQPQERQGLIPLSWEPGLHGKGLYFPEADKLTTWSDPRHHSDVWYDDEHYPLPGVAHHLDIQPNGQYVDQGGFNREMEDNNEGLDEVDLAQALKRHDPRLTDRDPGHEWSFAKVAHALGWQPGEHGKGLIHDGEVHTWGVGDDPDGQPTHPEYAQQNFNMNEGQYANHQMFESAFQMDPKGNVNIYEDHPDTINQVAQAVESADPRLKANVLHDYDWDFGNVEPMKTEPDMDEHGNLHGVQFTNDEPGVSTVDA
jgi:2'-5' RNA ligase